MALWSLLSLLALIAPVLARAPVNTAQGNIEIRVITWNTDANKWAKGEGFTDESLEAVLGFNNNKPGNEPSIYAIGLQEQLWKCHKYEKKEIGLKFTNYINKRSKSVYHFEIFSTRESTSCGTCFIKCFLTTNILIISKLNAEYKEFHLNDGCSSQQKVYFRDSEKGLAAYKMKLNNGKTLCFASAHLDSQKATWRRQCLKLFYKNANDQKNDEGVNWSKDCDAQFIFGDLNTRTKDKEEEKCEDLNYGNLGVSNYDELRKKDELRGTTPYGAPKRRPKYNLLKYLNDQNNGARTVVNKTKQEFKECTLKFLPTYSLLHDKCGGKMPCYCPSRPQSWTDRILYTEGKCLEYDSIMRKYGDHFPVFARFSVNIGGTTAGDDITPENSAEDISSVKTAVAVSEDVDKSSVDLSATSLRDPILNVLGSAATYACKRTVTAVCKDDQETTENNPLKDMLLKVKCDVADPKRCLQVQKDINEKRMDNSNLREQISGIKTAALSVNEDEAAWNDAINTAGKVCKRTVKGACANKQLRDGTSIAGRLTSSIFCQYSGPKACKDLEEVLKDAEIVNKPKNQPEEEQEKVVHDYLDDLFAVEMDDINDDAPTKAKDTPRKTNDEDDDLIKEDAFAIEDDAMRNEYRNVLYSVIRDNIANDFDKLKDNSKQDQFDNDSSQEMGDFTENLKRSILEELDMEKNDGIFNVPSNDDK